MSSEIAQHYWHAWDTMLNYVEQVARKSGFVVEVGPGYQAFAPANEYVDWGYIEQFRQSVPEGRKLHLLDITSERMPFADKSVDFIYCRHTLEDIYNPYWACQEMARVAKAGYIETPSPLAEICRGIDARNPPWRGYHHHLYLIWNDNGILTFVPKYPIIEHYSFGELESQAVSLLNEGPLHWNTYYFWSDSIKIQSLYHGRDFDVTNAYGQVIAQGIQKTLEHHQRIKVSPDYRSC